MRHHSPIEEPGSMKYYVEIGDRTFEVEIGPEGVKLDGQPVEADLKANHGSHLWHLVLDGRSHTLRARRRDGRGDWELEVDGRRHRVVALDERSRAIRELTGTVAVSQGPLEVTAPMPGLVIKVEVVEDEQVGRGQGLIVIEAMKMENELKATSAGRVAEVRVAPGQAVDKGETLLVIEPVSAGG
ncbi:MAG: acetyl-CoA carboxylase biotin carboxyl carrier protein subunit [Gemmatimonadota bacterium]|nr:MAG: acetyl-CoA carboxylase biotin carboxyl carrier protein subunit [Gemmatimonadota bacterium]